MELQGGLAACIEVASSKWDKVQQGDGKDMLPICPRLYFQDSASDWLECKENVAIAQEFVPRCSCGRDISSATKCMDSLGVWEPEFLHQ